MPFYVRHGEIPRKRHTQFRDASGALRYEEHVSRQGFSGAYSNLYHLRMPTRVERVGDFTPLVREAARVEHRARHLRTAHAASSGDPFSSRRLLFFNDDLQIHKAHVTAEAPYLYRNGHFDELVYVQKGSGSLRTNLGTIAYSAGDYLVIPRGVIQQWKLYEPSNLLVIESRGPVDTPQRYRNEQGQLLESSPFCERDIRVPSPATPIDELGSHQIRVRLSGGWQDYYYANHPFDVVGWDGCYYPWAFSIHDFEPMTGSLHLPPPVHQSFQAPGFVVCSFVSRMFDYHPESIPAPYPHSNVDSDEIIFYSWGNFMSRKGIENESITLHPMGIPHGPQPGRYEDSIGRKNTEELAVMIDTFSPLQVAPAALAMDDPEYPTSWME